MSINNISLDLDAKYIINTNIQDDDVHAYDNINLLIWSFFVNTITYNIQYLYYQFQMVGH